MHFQIIQIELNEKDHSYYPGTFSPLQDRLPVAPDLNNPVIENLEILPRFPGRDTQISRDMTAVFGILRSWRISSQNIIAISVRGADMRTYPLDPDKYRATGSEEDKIIVRSLYGLLCPAPLPGGTQSPVPRE